MGKSIRSHLSLHGRAGRVLATLMLAGVLGLALPATAEPACKIEIGSCHREPLSNARGTGVVDRIVVELFRRVGQSACISQLPCERSLLNANSGVSDGDILRVPSVIDERYPNLLVVPELLYPLPMNGFTNRQDVQPHGLAELAPLKVGFVLGWKILEDEVHAAKVVRAPGAVQLFPLLTEGKADIVIYERLTGLQTIRDLGLVGIRVLDPPLLVTPQHLVLHKRHQALLEPLAAALRAMKADGSYDKAFRQAGFEPPAMR